MGYSKEYVQERPAGYPDHLHWPGTYDIVDTVGKIANLNFPYYPPSLDLPHFPKSQVHSLRNAQTI